MVIFVLDNGDWRYSWEYVLADGSISSQIDLDNTDMASLSNHEIDICIEALNEAEARKGW